MSEELLFCRLAVREVKTCSRNLAKQCRGVDWSFWSILTEPRVVNRRLTRSMIRVSRRASILQENSGRRHYREAMLDHDRYLQELGNAYPDKYCSTKC